MLTSRRQFALWAAVVAFATQSASAQVQLTDSIGPTQLALEQACAAGKYTFIVFYKTQDAATQALVKNLEQGIAARAQEAVVLQSQVGVAADWPLVERFGLARAPMPMAVAVGPNNALTGIFRRDTQPAAFLNAFVAPTMLQCMKHLQEGKLVFVNVHSTPEPQVPAGVALFAGSPEFQQRTVFVSMSSSDTREGVLMGQMKVNPASIQGTTSVLIAPPGVLIGQYDTTATADQIGQAVHKAGKCCDDPNCKHNRP